MSHQQRWLVSPFSRWLLSFFFLLFYFLLCVYYCCWVVELICQVLLILEISVNPQWQSLTTRSSPPSQAESPDPREVTSAYSQLLFHRVLTKQTALVSISRWLPHPVFCTLSKGHESMSFTEIFLRILIVMWFPVWTMQQRAQELLTGRHSPKSTQLQLMCPDGSQ